MDVFFGWNAGLSLQRRWLLLWVCFMGKIMSFAVKRSWTNLSCKKSNETKCLFYRKYPQNAILLGFVLNIYLK